VFKRRTPRSYVQIVGEAFYPRGGWTRAAWYVAHRLRRLPDPAHRISRGIFAGVFVSFTPFYGLHFLAFRADRLDHPRQHPCGPAGDLRRQSDHLPVHRRDLGRARLDGSGQAACPAAEDLPVLQPGLGRALGRTSVRSSRPPSRSGSVCRPSCRTSSCPTSSAASSPASSPGSSPTGSRTRSSPPTSAAGSTS
jgi:hypothetical protein